MIYNPHVREITNEYLKEKRDIVSKFFERFKKKDLWGHFANFYKNLLRQTTDTKYFINFFQEVNNILATVILS